MKATDECARLVLDTYIIAYEHHLQIVVKFAIQWNGFDLQLKNHLSSDTGQKRLT